MATKTLLIAGGGTGGHLFPGLAVAEEFLERDPAGRVVFVGAEGGIEARRVPAAGYEFYPIRSRGIAGKGLVGKLKGIMVLPLSLLDAARAVRKAKPAVALGVGGFVSGPAILAAALLGVPCAIQEQNAMPGFANRILSVFVDAVFISFEPARGRFGRAERRGKVRLTGNPARKMIRAAIARAGAQGRAESNGRFRLLVVGGSQGAQALNRLVPAAVARMAEAERRGLFVRHQSGERERAEVEARYRELGVAAETVAFIEDMAAAYFDADLIVSRSGAGAVTEIALAGLPSILVPYPFAASDHQALNAAALVEAGAAIMARESELDGPKLMALIGGLRDDPARRGRMAEAARRAARPAAAAEIVDHCLGLIGGAGSGPGPGAQDETVG